MSFQMHCKAVVKEYLQTALIIDDQAAIGAAQSVGTPVISVSNIEDQGALFSNDTSQITTPVNITASSLEPENQLHDFDAAKATDAFYEKGIIAGLYRPVITNEDTVDSFASSVVKIASRADVIIVDWILKRGRSDYSKALIKHVLESDQTNGGRLRSIVVYTGEANLSDLRDELKNHLKKSEKLDLTNLENKGDFGFKSNNLVVTFYNKMGSGLSIRQKCESDLPDIALEEYSQLVKGIVPAFAMKSAAKIRENTGRIIAKFDDGLDEGFLGHRSLLPNPEDSEVFMFENFISYLRNILAISQVDKATLGIDVIKKWLEGTEADLGNSITFIDSTDDKEEIACVFTKEQLENILSHGAVRDKHGLFKELKANLGKDPAKEIFRVNETTARFISAFDRTEGSCVRSTKKLAVLTSFRRTYEDILFETEKPYLTQGTLVQDIENSKYYLCVTPKCDTARVNRDQIFSFSELKKPTSNNNPDLIVYLKDSHEYISLVTSKKFVQLKHIHFNGGSEKRVVAIKSANKLIFRDNNEIEYEWIGDLEDMEIQKRVSDIVGNFNRVGTDEVEWLRRQ